MSATTADSYSSSTCDYCGLPLSTRVWSWRGRTTTIEPEGARPAPTYCCFGCQIAAQITGQRGERGAVQWTLLRIGLSVFLSLNVMMFTMALWSEDFYDSQGLQPGVLARSLADLFRYLCLLLSLPVLLLLGVPLWDHAWRRGLRGLAATDLLILLGVIASFLYSMVSVFRGQGQIYFEVGCAVLVMVTLGRWLEAAGKLQANEALDALDHLLPDKVRRLGGGTEDHVELRQVAVGDRLRVLAGERIPTDGRVVRGCAAVDRQLLTGESRPLLCEIGDDVLAGSLNLDGNLTIEVTSSADNGALARLVQQVRQARANKGHYQRLADRVAHYFLPVVLTVTVGTFAGHALVDGMGQAILSSLAVLLIACPCSLGVATPLAVSTALGTAAGKQVLFRSGEALERLAAIRAIRFDKTGTLTTGQPTVQRFLAPSGVRADEVLRRAAALAGTSTHLFSQAISDWCRATLPEADSLDAEDVRDFPGRGVSGRLARESGATLLGSLGWMLDRGWKLPAPLVSAVAEASADEQSLSAIGWDGQVRGVFALREQLRPSAVTALAQCADMGLDVGILTGDHRQRGAALSGALQVPVEAELLPEDKVSALTKARARFGPVAMVGEGVNDAPALEAADLGIALRCGADISRESAGVCLLGDDPAGVPWALSLSRRTVRVIRWNLFWAFGYNLIGVALAASGRLNPAWAALAMVLSSALVVGNCLRLQSGPMQSLATAVDSPESPLPAGEVSESRDSTLVSAS